MTSRWRWAAGAILLGVLGVVVPKASHATAASSVSLFPCHVGQLAEEVQCGVVEVPESRARPDGRRIGIHVSVLPALRRLAAPDPLLVFAGGPGQGARDFAEIAHRYFRSIRRR